MDVHEDEEQQPSTSSQGPIFAEMRLVKKEDEKHTSSVANVGYSEFYATSLDATSGYEEAHDEEEHDQQRLDETVADVVNEVFYGQNTQANGGEPQPCSTATSLTMQDIFALSPLSKRLRENRSYNKDSWSSIELKSLYEGITTYGTTDEALEVIQLNYCPTRSLTQVIAKVTEIREINREHREERMRVEGDFWLATGYREVRPPPQYVVAPPIDNWEAGIQRVNRQLRSQNDHALRTAIENAFLSTIDDEANPKKYKVTDSRSGRGYGKEQAISWHRVGSFFAGVMRHVRPLPALNTLECAVVLQIMDDVEEEVSQSLTDEDKAIIRGWFANVQMRNLTDFLPDTPYTPNTAAHVLLDPLRTRLWNISEQGCALPTDVEDLQLQIE